MGGKLSPPDPMGSPGKPFTDELRLTPACELPWPSLLLRLLPRISKGELKRRSFSCRLRSPISFCELPSSPAGALIKSVGDGKSFLPPAVASSVDDV